MKKNKVLLVISQVYPPDPAAVGQYMDEAAREMSRRGWTVSVLTANRGYDNPEKVYPRRETIAGVLIRRLSISSFGKSSILVRLLAGLIFTLQCFFYAMFMRNLESILVSTSPPLAPIAAVAVKKLRRVPYSYWVMDINPDQMVKLGMITEKSLAVWFYNRLNRFILKNVDSVITLDQDMAENIVKKIDVTNQLYIIPPWPLLEQKKLNNYRDNLFRNKYHLDHKFVFMYSGNHSMANPLDTLLKAALNMQDRPDIVFFFIGGGVKKPEIDQLIEVNQTANIFSLPYQPLNSIGDSLAAADVHIVSMGAEMVGVVHPSKIYGAMAVGRPVLAIVPAKSNIYEMVKEYRIGWQVDHGDIDGMMTTLRKIVSLPRQELDEMGKRAKELAGGIFSKDELLNKFCNVIESKFI